MKNKGFLIQLRKKIQFLRKVPNEIYFKLDISELHLPENECLDIMEQLKKQIGHYIMSYKASGFNMKIPIEKHLCAHIKPAKLNKKQLKLLKSVEKKYIKKGISFSVYNKPLQIINIKNINGLYTKQGFNLVQTFS